MTAILDPVTFERLRKVCALLESDSDGERANAAALGTRMLRAHGMKWRDVINLPEPGVGYRSDPKRDESPRRYAAWQETARALLHRYQMLSAKEECFVADILRLTRLTPKQEAWLTAIAGRVLGAQP